MTSSPACQLSAVLAFNLLDSCRDNEAKNCSFSANYTPVDQRKLLQNVLDVVSDGRSTHAEG